MQRINPINEADAPQKTVELLNAVRKQMGGVPKILGTMAQSSAALGGYLNLAGALAGGKLSAKLREQIALAVAGANSCDYCASVHTALAAKVGVTHDELSSNLSGQSADSRVQAALQFARQIVATRGNVTNAQLTVVRGAGFSDEEIVEILANTVLNIFTNYFNHVAGTEIDFPAVSTSHVAAA